MCEKIKINRSSILADSYDYSASITDDGVKFASLFAKYGWVYPHILLQTDLFNDMIMNEIEIEDIYSHIYSNFSYDFMRLIVDTPCEKVLTTIDYLFKLLNRNFCTLSIIGNILFRNIYQMSAFVSLSKLLETREDMIRGILNKSSSNERTNIFMFFYFLGEYEGYIFMGNKDIAISKMRNFLTNKSLEG